MRTFVIAEAGICHENVLDYAKRMVYEAAAAGADAVKFQFWSDPEKMVRKRQQKPEAKKVYQRYQLNRDWLPILKNEADEAGIEFMCTTYLHEDVDVVAPFVSRMKIAHLESNDKSFTAKNTAHGKQVIISRPRGHGYWQNKRVKNLYCVPLYPTPNSEVHLEQMVFSGCEGFSDHTKNVLMGCAAVIAGAEIVEVHFHHDKTSEDNPDFKVSHGHAQLVEYVAQIRWAEIVSGEDSGAPIVLVPPVSAEQLSHQPGSVVYDLSADLREGSFGVRWQEPPPQDKKNSPQGGPHA